MRIGITLPQFSANALAMVDAARRAEGEGLDAVFAYDHYPRTGRPEALHGLTMLGAISQATDFAVIGTLVARIGVVPDGVLISSFRTAARLAPGRFVAGGARRAGRPRPWPWAPLRHHAGAPSWSRRRGPSRPPPRRAPARRPD